MDKKMYKYIGILVGLVVLLVIFFWLGNLLTGGTKYSYESIEETMINAAKSYAEKHTDILPTEPGDSIIVASTTLINTGEMKEFSDYLKDEEIICTGSVEIFLVNDDIYNYVPDFNCGNKHNTIKLADQVIIDNEFGIVQGNGLYQRIDGNFVTEEEGLDSFDETNEFEYVFRGKDVDNYVKIDDMIWRIISITQDNDMLLIYDGKLQKNSAWDDRYNEDIKRTQGINEYFNDGLKSVSMEIVESFYEGNEKLSEKVEYSSKLKYLTAPMTLCIGKRSTTDSDITGATECLTTLEKQYVGLLPAYYYMSASLDDGCDSIVSKNCGNENYLARFDDYWWLLTTNAENTHEGYIVAKKFAQTSICSARSNIKPIILLGSRTLYESGTGTQTDPYTVKFYE